VGERAEALAEAGQCAAARRHYEEAARLGPYVPPVLMRIANFEIEQDRFDAAVPYLRRVVDLTDAYDGILFHYYARSGWPVERLFAEGLPEPSEALAHLALPAAGRHASAPDGVQRPAAEPARKLFRYLAATGHTGAEAGWRWLRERGFVDNECERAWREHLIGVRRDAPQASAEFAAVRGAYRDVHDR
jgi:tetratricopeptide (TPR) repeat protein